MDPKLNLSQPSLQDMSRVANSEGAEGEVDRLHKKFDKKEKAPVKEGQSVVSSLMDDDSSASKDEFMFNATKHSAKNKLSKRDKMMEKQLEKEMGKMFKNNDSYDDNVTLSSIATQTESLVKDEDKDSRLKQLRRQSVKQSKQTKEASATKQSQSNAFNVKKETVSKFTSAFSQYALNKNSDQKRKLEESKKELIQQGLSKKDVFQLESSVGEVVKQQFLYDLKSGLLREYFASGTPKKGADDYFGEKYELSNAKYTNFERSKQLDSLAEKGIVKSGKSVVLERIGAELRSEMEGFIFDEVSHNITKAGLGQMTGEEYTQQLVKLNESAQAAGIVLDQEALSIKVGKTIEELGLEEFVAPPGSGSFSFSEGDSQEKPKEEPKIYVNPQEQLEDTLRDLYMKQLLTGGLKDGIQIKFKMKKMKNGLIKLGLYTPEKDLDLKEQGRFLAKMRLIESLEDSYREQATLDALSGPAYSAIKGKRAFSLKQLKRLDFSVKKQDLEKIRDKQNMDMGCHIMDQIRQLEVAMEVKSTAYRANKHASLKKILDRLIEETPLLKGVIKSDLFLESEQKFSDVA